MRFRILKSTLTRSFKQNWNVYRWTRPAEWKNIEATNYAPHLRKNNWSQIRFKKSFFTKFKLTVEWISLNKTIFIEQLPKCSSLIYIYTPSWCLKFCNIQTRKLLWNEILSHWGSVFRDVSVQFLFSKTDEYLQEHLLHANFYSQSVVDSFREFYTGNILSGKYYSNSLKVCLWIQKFAFHDLVSHFSFHLKLLSLSR